MRRSGLAILAALTLACASLAARAESLAAFDGRCIPAGCVAPRSNTAGIAPHRAQHARWGPRMFGRRAVRTGVPSAAAALGWSSGRLARLGATPDFHHGPPARADDPPRRRPLNPSQRTVLLSLLDAVDTAQRRNADADTPLSWSYHVFKAREGLAYL